MNDSEISRIEALLDRDPELRELWQEHLELKSQIEQLEKLPHMAPAERMARKELQKRKLAGKDRIVEILDRPRAD